MSPSTRLLQLVLTILLFTSNSLLAQTPTVDSLLDKLKTAQEDTNKVLILNELCWELALTDSESAIKYGKSAVSLSTKLNYRSGQSVGLYYLGSVYQKQGENQLALAQTKKALSIDEKDKNLAAIASDHNQLGTCYKKLGNHDKAIFHFFKSLEMQERLGDMHRASQTKLNIANFLFDRGEYPKAIQLAKEAKTTFEQAEDRIMTALALEMMAMGSKRIGKLNKSLSLFKEAYYIFKNEGNIYLESECINNIGIVYHEMKDLDKAFYYLDKSLKIEDSLGRKHYQAVSHANLALLYDDMGEKDKSIKHVNQSIALSSEIGELIDVMTLMEISSEIFYENEDYKKAYDHLSLAQKMKDTLFSERKTEAILSIREQYETKKRTEEIISLKKERDLSQAKAKLADTVILFSIGSGVLLLIVVFFFFRNRKIKEKQKKAELEQKVLRAQMNPHFIFNSLNSIQRIFIEGDEDLANDYISDFGKLLRIIMENSGRDKVSIKKEIDTLKLYLDIEMIRLDGQIEYTFEIDPNLDLLNNFIPPLIIQPFVENAIWHGILPKESDEKGQITVQVTRQSSKLVKCCITDNGIGISKSLAMKRNTKHTSKGMSITHERLGSAIQMDEIKTGGTKITLLIPLN